MSDRLYSLTGVTLVTPEEIVPDTALTVQEAHIAALGEGGTGHARNMPGAPGSSLALLMRDCLLFPGLINAHEHLNGTWWPRVGPNRPYVNVYEWLADLDESPVRYDRQQNAVEDIYELGMYRNLISGVTTIADHFWRIDGSEFYTRHPVHVLYQYGRTWTPRALTDWGGDIPTEYGLAVHTGQPYIIHLAEGLDQETAAEMDVLLQFDALGRNTMVVHGISLRPQDMRMMAEAGASVCWCPGSNLYLYGQTADIRALLAAGVNVTIGTDSTLTGGLYLLDEIRLARDAFRTQTGEEPSSRWLVELMTTRAAHALMLEGRRGRIAPGYEADLLALSLSTPAACSDPYTALVEADVADIALLICAGVPVYGDVQYHSLFERFSPGFAPVSVAGKEKLIAGNLLFLLDRIFKAVGRKLEFPFLPCARP